MKTGIYWQDPKYAVGRCHNDPSCVLYLPLHRLDGASFMSKDAYGHLCTVTGALWTPQGRHLDGLDDFIDCGSATSLDIARSLTLITWAKLDVVVANQPDSKPSLLVKQVSGYLTANYYVVIGKAGDNFDFYARNSDGDGAVINDTSITASTYLDDLAWHQITCVWDRDSLISYIYIDGIERSKMTGRPDKDLYATGNNRLSIGRATAQNDRFLDGYVGEVRIYNRALTPLKIQRNYLATKRRYR